jgi:acetylornithine deacetylase
MESGFRTDMAVVAEPFGVGNLITVHSGIVHMAIHTYGVTGHIRQPQGTVNAVEKMTRVIDALGRVEFTYQPRADMPDLPKLNVGSVIGGLGEDYILVEPPYIPDLCTIIVDVHFVPGQTVVGIVADIRRVLDPLQAGDPELSYEIEIPPPESFKGRRRLVMDPLDVPRDAEIVQAVARCHREVTGEPPKAIGAVLPFSYTANDTCHLWNAGIPCLLYGPAVVRGGDGEDDSCVIISEMVQCAKVLALTALDVCGTAES